MSTFEARTVAVDNNGQPTWQSPDGQRKLWSITMVAGNGQAIPGIKTYSQAIATVGFGGRVDTYEKTGTDRNGNAQVQTFVRQWQDPAKQQGFQQGSSSQPMNGAQQSTGSKAGYQPKDEAAIKAMWAIGQVVVLYIDPTDLDFTFIEQTAVKLFHMVDRVKSAPEPREITKEDITQAFGGGESFDDGGAPAAWASN